MLSNRIPPLAELYGDGLRPEPDVPDLGALVPVGLNERLRYYRYWAVSASRRTSISRTLTAPLAAF